MQLLGPVASASSNGGGGSEISRELVFHTHLGPGMSALVSSVCPKMIYFSAVNLSMPLTPLATSKHTRFPHTPLPSPSSGSHFVRGAGLALSQVCILCLLCLHCAHFVNLYNTKPTPPSLLHLNPAPLATIHIRAQPQCCHAMLGLPRPSAPARYSCRHPSRPIASWAQRLARRRAARQAAAVDLLRPSSPTS